MWQARLGKIPVNYWPVSKRVISEVMGKADSMTRAKLFICTQNTRMCHSTWKALGKHKGWWQEDSPKVPPPMNIYRWWTLSSVSFHHSLTRTFEHWNTRQEAPASTQGLEHKWTSKSSFCLMGMCIMKLSLRFNEQFSNSQKGRKLNQTRTLLCWILTSLPQTHSPYERRISKVRLTSTDRSRSCAILFIVILV